jgi:hypothetical protein
MNNYAPCNIKYNNPIISIHKINNLSISEYYVFIGEVTSEIDNILKKLENRKNTMKEELLILKKNYPDNYSNWIQIIKKKIKIRFIYCTIKIDDKISEIRNKIFIYLSDFDNKNFILPENQELWVKKNKNDYIIGYYYENILENERINITPHIYEETNFNTISNNSLLVNKNIRINTSENSMVLIDLFNDIEVSDYTIYLSDAKEEENILKSKRIDITPDILNYYFKKYWPYFNLNYDVNEIKNNYLIMKEIYEKEIYLFDLLKSTKIDKNIFGSCNIITIKLNINNEKYQINEYENNNSVYNNEELKKTIDLYEIFDYLKDNKINDKMPYMKYSEDLLEAPFSIISKDAIKKNIIKKDDLKKWIGIDNEQRRMNGIIVKRNVKNYMNEPRYSSLFMNKFGHVQINVSFENIFNANLLDVENVVKDCKKFIEDINKNNKTMDKDIKINPPDFDFKDREVILKKNTKIVFMNISIPLRLNKPLDFTKLLEFSKYFPYFLSELPKDSIKKENKVGGNTENTSIKLKYKRVSGFANWNEILEVIDILKQKDEKDSIILRTLEKKFNKSLEEVKKYLLEWKKKYYSSQSYKIDPKYKKGILVSITNNNIKLDGVTKIYQIPLLYNFFTVFMTLFINYEEYIKDKLFAKFVKAKNLQSDYYDKSYEINKNAKLEIDDIYEVDYDYDNDIILEDDIYDTSISNKNQYNIKKIEGLARDEDIDPNIRLTCDDIIVEKDTCEDFCNDQRYFLRRLQRYDNKLFKFSVDKKNKQQQYSRLCQSERQPIVLAEDPANNPDIKKDSFTFALKYSSNPEIPRWYICPKIWCPYCEIPILESEIDKKTIRKRATKDRGGYCVVGKCPYGDHQVFVRDTSTSTSYLYPGFSDSAFNPDGLCLPCCFKKSQMNPDSTFYKGFKKCIGDEIENTNVKDGQIYILGKGIPIEKDRYAKLPLEVSRILNTKLDTGYLEFQSGYLRKGIKHESNNSFLSAICDILSCNKNNMVMNLIKLKNILLEKLTPDLFRSLHSGNLPNIFHNPKSTLSAYDNYKNYIINSEYLIDHTYLWDYLQRPDILFDSGINIFIFDNTRLLCPFGEIVQSFYDNKRSSILLIKHKEYYEPIYYLEGDGKLLRLKQCIFDRHKVEIKKLYEISLNGCKSYFDIDWVAVLKNNMKRYDLSIDNICIDLGDNLEVVLNELIVAIKNNKLAKEYLPELQYVDSYNKVFGIKLKNNLYLPVSPSKLIYQIKYKTVNDMNLIEKLDLKSTVSLTNMINDNTNLKCKITHKVLDMKNKEFIYGIINERNRFIPVDKQKDNDKKLKISSFNIYTNVDQALMEKIELIDKRIEKNNNNKFEEESYIRMKFELSKFLNLKENNHYLKDIHEIINLEGKNIAQNRIKLFSVLNNIFTKILFIQNKKMDFNYYKTPNKRIPCFLRDIKKTGKNKNSSKNSDKDNQNNMFFTCEDDPHCIVHKNKCKLFINEKNVVDIHKNINNYSYYISKIIDELLRFKLKRNEILNNKIPVIINKELIEKINDKFVMIHTLNTYDINYLIDKLYVDTKNLFLDDRKLFEENSTKEYSFKKDKYIKSTSILIEDYKMEDLSVYWDKFLGNKFKIRIYDKDTIFSIMKLVLNMEELKSYKEEQVNVIDIKNKLVSHIKKIASNKKNNNNIEKELLELYANNCDKKLKYITSIQSLIGEILTESYEGCYIDLKYLSSIYKLNIIILDKRRLKDKEGHEFIKCEGSNYYIILYRVVIVENNIYYLIQNKNMIVFKKNDLPTKFYNHIVK